MNEVLSKQTVDKIRQLNDDLRRTFTGGTVLMTSGVAALDVETKAKVLTAVREFTAFDDDNDPHGEHDMCFIEVGGERYWSKIDYYDRDMRYLSDDPSDSAVTKRVMTIGTAGEY